MNFLRKQFLIFATRKHTLIMRNLILAFFSTLISFNTFSQTIKREMLNETGLGGKKFYAKIRSNIFTDYPWINPEFQSKKIIFSNHFLYFELNGLSFQITEIDTNLMELKGSSSSMLIEKKVSNGEIYYEKNRLTSKTVEKQKWVPHLTLDKKIIPVKHLSPGSTTNYYTSFESHETPAINWKWENTNDSILKIPSYSYYQFELNDGRILFLYETINNAGIKEYFLQNASYLFASDADGVEYIFLDNNCNGNYTDAGDKFFFKSWNPYLRESKFKKISFAKENTWYDYSFFQDNFLIPYQHEGKLHFESIPENYASSNQKGILKIKNISKKSTLVINKKEYPIHRWRNKFDCEYGIYKATISNKGFVDYETIFTINDGNPLEEIICQKNISAGTLLINNIFFNDYFITIKNATGFIKTYRNTNKIEAPKGINELIIYFDGYQISHQVEVNQNETIEFDFENELNKIVKSR